MHGYDFDFWMSSWVQLYVDLFIQMYRVAGFKSGLMFVYQGLVSQNLRRISCWWCERWNNIALIHMYRRASSVRASWNLPLYSLPSKKESLWNKAQYLIHCIPPTLLFLLWQFIFCLSLIYSSTLREALFHCVCEVWPVSHQKNVSW